MAYDKTPSQSTYQTKNIKLLYQWETRDRSNAKDNETINCYYEVIKNKFIEDKDYYVTSRDGTTTYPVVMPSTNIRGMHYWEDQDKLFIAYDQTIVIITGSTGVVQTSFTPGFAAGTSEVGFEEFNYDIGVVKLVVTDGTVLGTIDSANNFVACSDPDLPVPHLPYPVFLDGYLFIVKANTADIYNSNLNDPLAYTSGDFITAEMLPDNLVRLSRLNNYIVAFGTASIEYYWDAANASGSPLQRNDTPVKLIGYVGGLAHWGNKIFFVGNTDTTAPELFMLEDFKIESLGIPPLRRYIEPYSTSTGTTISFGGHDFYVLNIGTLTYVVDLESKLWTRIAYQQQTNFPIKFAVTLPISGYGNASLVVQTGSGTLSYFRTDLYLDNGVDFTPTLVTDNEDFGSYNNKFGGSLCILADRPTNSAYVTIYWTDDDYQTWSAGRQISLNQIYPQTSALGKFRRRAHKIVHTGNSRFRVQRLEMDVNLGVR